VRLRKGGYLPPAEKRGKDFVPTEEEPIAEPRVIILRIHDHDEVIFTAKGYNTAHFAHINLPKEDHEYLLTCHYDLREWPDAV
jgi:hypothetical protein